MCTISRPLAGRHSGSPRDISASFSYPGRFGRARFVDLGPAAAIDDAVRRFRRQIERFGGAVERGEEQDEQRAEAALRPLGRNLARLIFEPLRAALGPAKRLYIAADAELHRVAYEALPGTSDRYLVEDGFQFVYLSSGRDLLRPETAPGSGTVVFASPDYNLDAASRRTALNRIQNANATSAPTRSGIASFTASTPWRSLDTTREAIAIEQELNNTVYGPVRTHLRADALQEVFQAVSSPRILHVATHGFFLDESTPRQRQSDNPLLRSGLVLSGANVPPNRKQPLEVADGWVTAEDVTAMNLNGTELVVLSACDTGLGQVRSGEGVYGLRRAFLLAGARSLIMSLYKVPNEETAGLMKRFYQNLKVGRGKLESLRQAEVSVLQERRAAHGAAHPFYWASFVLVGDPR